MYVGLEADESNNEFFFFFFFNSMVQHPVARVLQKFISFHRTQLQS
jgi:hypothetical protein